MECSCDVGSYDGDDEDFGWSVRYFPKSGKQHICYECKNNIEKGTPFFMHITVRFDCLSRKIAKSYIYKVCPDCQSILDNFFQSGWMFGSSLPSLDKYLRSIWDEDLPSSCISKLSPKARDIVCDILQTHQFA